MKVVFFISNVRLPRCVNRVEQFAQRGYDVEAYYFERTSGEHREIGVPMHRLGTLDSGTGTYLKRMKILYSSIKGVLNNYKGQDIVYYIFGIDLAIIFYLCFSGAKYIFEESDMRHTYFRPKILSKFLGWVDEYIIRNSLLTVFTSEGFIKYHFGENYPNNVALIPNKLSPAILNYPPNQSHSLDMNKLVIGFVGSPRFKSVYNFVKVFCEKFPNFEFHFFGEPVLDKIEEHKNLKNCYFHGSFKSPNDLPSIYSQFDLVLSTYDAAVENVKYAEPNKIYESMYFEVPIIVSEGTFLADKVERLGIGYAIDPLNDDSIVEFIKELTEESINEKKDNIKRIDKESLLSINNEFYELLATKILK